MKRFFYIVFSVANFEPVKVSWDNRNLVFVEEIGSFISVIDPVDDSEEWKKDIALDIEEKKNTRVRIHSMYFKRPERPVDSIFF